METYCLIELDDEESVGDLDSAQDTGEGTNICPLPGCNQTLSQRTRRNHQRWHRRRKAREHRSAQCVAVSNHRRQHQILPTRSGTSSEGMPAGEAETGRSTGTTTCDAAAQSVEGILLVVPSKLPRDASGCRRWLQQLEKARRTADVVEQDVTSRLRAAMCDSMGTFDDLWEDHQKESMKTNKEDKPN